MRRWIVDANNVMGSRPDGWWRDRAGGLERLVGEVVRWRAAAGQHVVVVADGRPTPKLPDGERYGVMIRFAAAHGSSTADDDIVGLVADSDEGGTVVVTSDRELQARVRALGAEVEGARRFLDRIAGIEPQQDP